MRDCGIISLISLDMACVPRPVAEGPQFLEYYRSHCACCDAQGPKFRCARCSVAHYCNADHQTADWPRHKGECRRWAQIFATSANVLPPSGVPDNIIEQHKAVGRWRDGPLDETETAAEGGNADAQFALAQRLLFGIGVTKNFKKSMIYLKKASDKGQASAQTMWGAYLRDGEVIAQNVPEALRLFTLAAQQGLPDAQFELATLYEFGVGVDRNMEEAIRLYRLAANGEDNDAKQALARLGQHWKNTRDRSRKRKQRKHQKTRKN